MNLNDWTFSDWNDWICNWNDGKTIHIFYAGLYDILSLTCSRRGNMSMPENYRITLSIASVQVKLGTRRLAFLSICFNIFVFKIFTFILYLWNILVLLFVKLFFFSYKIQFIFEIPFKISYPFFVYLNTNFLFVAILMEYANWLCLAKSEKLFNFFVCMCCSSHPPTS